MTPGILVKFHLNLMELTSITVQIITAMGSIPGTQHPGVTMCEEMKIGIIALIA